MVEEQTRELVREERRIFFKRLAWYRRRVESLETQAVLDDLTGLRNQRALWRELTRRAGASSSAAPLAVVMLDFDMFNEVNERYGHAVGDAVLRRAAAVLRDSAPSPRLAFRYGGEEFVVLVPGTEDDGYALAEEIRAEVARQNGKLPAVTVSCGVAEFDRPVEPWLALDRADAALRAAKRTGRNRVVVSGWPQPTGSPYVVEELEHETARRAALALAMATLEVRDSNTAHHSDDVLTLCESVGRQLGLDARALERLMAGAQLHDVGKVGIPSEILNKPGPLNENEWAVIREHTVIGERILRSVPEMAEVATIVRHSHERWDGGGYPDGLKGEQIPLASRIILCADAFHAIRSDRPYRRGRPAADAIAELRASAGTQLDPAVVAALAQVADDVREQKASGAATARLPRNRRLVALLAALAVGSTTAVAASPALREELGDMMHWLFGTTTVDSAAGTTFGYDPTLGFRFGPLGDKLSIDPAVRKHAAGNGGATPTATRAQPDRAAGQSTGRRRGGAFRTTRGGRLAGGALGRQTAPKSVPTPAPTPAGPGPQPASPTPTVQGQNNTAGGGRPPKAHGKAHGNGKANGKSNGNGNGLGHTLPTPRRPAQPPGHTHSPGSGRPDSPGRSDPPAIGRNNNPSSPNGGPGNGKGNPHKP